MVDRRKTLSASVLQRDTHEHAWKTSELVEDNKTTPPTWTQNVGAETGSPEWSPAFPPLIAFKSCCYCFNYCCLGCNPGVVLAGHLCYLLIINQLKTVEEWTQNSTKNLPIPAPSLKLDAEPGRVLDKTAEHKQVSVLTLLWITTHLLPDHQRMGEMKMQHFYFLFMLNTLSGMILVLCRKDAWLM